MNAITAICTMQTGLCKPETNIRVSSRRAQGTLSFPWGKQKGCVPGPVGLCLYAMRIVMYGNIVKVKGCVLVLRMWRVSLGAGFRYNSVHKIIQ